MSRGRQSSTFHFLQPNQLKQRTMERMWQTESDVKPVRPHPKTHTHIHQEEASMEIRTSSAMKQICVFRCNSRKERPNNYDR